MKAQERGENETREWEGGLLKGIYPAATSDFDFLSISHFSLETLFLELSPLPSSLFLFMESRVIQMDPTATSKSPPVPLLPFPAQDSSLPVRQASLQGYTHTEKKRPVRSK